MWFGKVRTNGFLRGKKIQSVGVNSQVNRPWTLPPPPPSTREIYSGSSHVLSKSVKVVRRTGLMPRIFFLLDWKLVIDDRYTVAEKK